MVYSREVTNPVPHPAVAAGAANPALHPSSTLGQDTQTRSQSCSLLRKLKSDLLLNPVILYSWVQVLGIWPNQVSPAWTQFHLTNAAKVWVMLVAATNIKSLISQRVSSCPRQFSSSSVAFTKFTKWISKYPLEREASTQTTQIPL